MYLSTTVHAGLVHVNTSSGFKLVIPEAGKETDPCNLNPTFSRLLEILSSPRSKNLGRRFVRRA